jgi:DNA-binding transcriptional LysR family regulator
VIDWGDERPDYPAIRWFTKATDIKRVIFRANSPSDRLTAAREGMGIALGPCLMAEADAGLVRLLPEIELVGPEVWLLVHRELADLARVRVVLDVLAQCARADVGRFAGRTKQVAGN